MTIEKQIDIWEATAESHRDMMRVAMESADGSSAEDLARAADDVTTALKAYAILLPVQRQRPAMAPPSSAEFKAGQRYLGIELALANLREARAELRLAGAGKAADYVARACKSAEGAYRHARRLLGEAARGAADPPAAV